MMFKLGVKELKKLIRKILAIATTITVIMALSLSASAANIAWTNAPSVKLGQWVAGPKYSLKGSEATAKGTNCYTYFQNYKSLPESFGNDFRGLEVYLMEDDLWNDDDSIKLYTGKFSGRKLSEIYLSDTYISGDVEDAGDPTVELYIRLKVYKGSNFNDPMDVYTGSLFQYSYGIK